MVVAFIMKPWTKPHFGTQDFIPIGKWGLLYSMYIVHIMVKKTPLHICKYLHYLPYYQPYYQPHYQPNYQPYYQPHYQPHY